MVKDIGHYGEKKPKNDEGCTPLMNILGEITKPGISLCHDFSSAATIKIRKQGKRSKNQWESEVTISLLIGTQRSSGRPETTSAGKTGGGTENCLCQSLHRH